MRNSIRGRAFILMSVFGLVLASSEATAQVNIFTSFEPIDYSLGTSDFVLGTPPDSAHFTGGIITTVGNPFAYRTGIASWGVLNLGGVGVVDFDNPASAVSMWIINLGGGSGVVDVFDNADVHIGQLPIVGTDMMQNNSFMSFVPADFGAVEIGKVTVTNDVNAGNQVWVDDFGATVNTPVPEPATLIVLAGGLALAKLRRRKRKA